MVYSTTMEERRFARGRRGGLALAALLLFGAVTLLPIYPTVGMARSHGAWAGGDRVSWGMTSYPLDEVFFWSRSWREHRMGSFVLLALLDPALALGVALALTKVVAKIASLARPLSPSVPFFAGGFVGACAVASLASVVRLVVDATGARGTAPVVAFAAVFVLGGAFATMAIAAYPDGSVTRRIGSAALSIPLAFAGAVAFASLVGRAGTAGLPNLLTGLLGLLMAPLAIGYVRRA